MALRFLPQSWTGATAEVQCVRSGSPCGGSSGLGRAPATRIFGRSVSAGGGHGRPPQSSRVADDALKAALRKRGGAANCLNAGAATDASQRHPVVGAPEWAFPASSRLQGAGQGGRRASTGGFPPLPVPKGAWSVPLLQLGRAVPEYTSDDVVRTPARRSPTAARGGGCSPQQTFIAQLEEFVHRGTPRPVVTSRGVLMPRRLEQHVATWVQSHGLSEGEVWLAALRPVPTTPPASEHEGIVQEAVINFRGVEFLVQMAASPQRAGGSSGDCSSSSSSTAIRASSAGGVVVGAQTSCAWTAMRHCVVAALRVAAGRPIDAFLQGLLGAWPDESAGAARGDAEAEDDNVHMQSPLRSSLDIGGPAAAAEAAADPAPATSGGSPPPLGRSPSRVSSGGASSVPVIPSACSPLSCLDDADEPSSFAEWLDERPPLLRFDHYAKGLAWDYPPTKVEKRELLMLHLLAEEEEREAELVAPPPSSRSPGLPAAAAAARGAGRLRESRRSAP